MGSSLAALVALRRQFFRFGTKYSAVTGHVAATALTRSAQILPPEDDDFQYKIKSTAERMSRRSRKASLIAPHKAGTLIEGYMMTLDYAASAELFMPKRQRGASAAQLPSLCHRNRGNSLRGRRITDRSYARCVDAGRRGAL
jgi:hypothetical protein